MIIIRRVYEPEKPGEHYKVFFDRLWPRGFSKDKAGWDEWMKDVSLFILKFVIKALR